MAQQHLAARTAPPRHAHPFLRRLAAAACALAIALCALPGTAHAQSQYLLSLTDANGNSLLSGNPVDPDALYAALCWQFQVPEDYATDPNAIVSGFRMTITDSSGAYVNSMRALGYLDPTRVNSNYIAEQIRLLPGETYTFSFVWITCSHLDGVGAEGTNGEVVVARESFTVSTTGSPQGEEDAGEGGQEVTPPVGSGEAADGADPTDDPEGAAAPDAPNTPAQPATPDAPAAPADPTTGADAPAEDAAEAGTATDASVAAATDDVFYGAPSQEGSVRPLESTQALAASRSSAAETLQAASTPDAPALARTGAQPGEAGLSAEKLMGLGSVHALQKGTLGDDAATASEGDTALEITTSLVLRWVLLVALVVGAAPAGALMRLLRTKRAAAQPSRLQPAAA